MKKKTKTHKEIIELKKASIRELHEREDNFNRELSELDKTIAQCKFKKGKISKAISKLIRYRNKLINEVYSKKEKDLLKVQSG